MFLKSTIKTLDDVRGYLETVEYINRGGCGVSALAMYKWLMKYTKIRSIKFMFVYSYKGESYKDNQNSINERENYIPVAPHHCCIVIGREKIDSNFCIPHRFTIEQPVTKKFLIDSLNNRGTWNRAFDRNKTKEIEKKLCIKLSEVSAT